jgi:fatty acid desaturase
MDRPGTHADIARIEARIETLHEAIARCRKIALAAKIAIVAGAAWLALTIVGLVPFVPTLLFGSLAVLIGGVVLAGSNSTTWQQTDDALAASEAMRRELIEQLDLRVIDDNVPTLH